MNRRIGLLAMMSPVWFASVYGIMVALRPDFSHLTKAISELGSVGAPRALAWNVLGYIVPGLCVALLGFGIRDRFARVRGVSIPAWGLIGSGLLMALSGLFPGDFENRMSTTMIVHAVGSIGSFAAFLVGALALARVVRHAHAWRPFVAPSLALVAGSIATGFLRSGSAPGLGQRLGFLCFFLWVALIGYALYSDPASSDRATPAGTIGSA